MADEAMASDGVLGGGESGKPDHDAADDAERECVKVGADCDDRVVANALQPVDDSAGPDEVSARPFAITGTCSPRVMGRRPSGGRIISPE
jgi:hypothetical protein